MQQVIDSIKQQFAEAGGDCRRLFHGRGGCVPGFEWLVIDLFPPVAVIRVFADAAPVGLEPIVDLLMGLGLDGVVVQSRGRGRPPEPEVVAGQAAKQVVVREQGLCFEVQPLAHQNSGLFLDSRPAREWVRSHASGLNVLNLFAYTCGFSVAAMAGGAASVVNLDMSSAALAQGRRNHRLNPCPSEQVSYLALDLLRSWSRVRKPGPYDLIIIDPPSFQKGSFVAEQDYRKVLRRLPELASSGAHVLACHNDPMHTGEFLRQLMAAEVPDFALERRLPLAEDFPELNPEAGLKALLYRRSV